jgi:hypothetical protein
MQRFIGAESSRHTCTVHGQRMAAQHQQRLHDILDGQLHLPSSNGWRCIGPSSIRNTSLRSSTYLHAQIDSQTNKTSLTPCHRHVYLYMLSTSRTYCEDGLGHKSSYSYIGALVKYQGPCPEILTKCVQEYPLPKSTSSRTTRSASLRGSRPFHMLWSFLTAKNEL